MNIKAWAEIYKKTNGLPPQYIVYGDLGVVWTSQINRYVSMVQRPGRKLLARNRNKHRLR